MPASTVSPRWTEFIFLRLAILWINFSFFFRWVKEGQNACCHVAHTVDKRIRWFIILFDWQSFCIVYFEGSAKRASNKNEKKSCWGRNVCQMLLNYLSVTPQVETHEIFKTSIGCECHKTNVSKRCTLYNVSDGSDEYKISFDGNKTWGLDPPHQ